MSIEALMLVCSVCLGVGQVLLAASAATKQYGVAWNISSRDSTMPKLSGLAGRLSRASENFKETFPFFASAVLLVLVLGKSNALSVYGSLIYFAFRLIYLPLYAFDVVYVRTLIWGVATTAIFAVLCAVFV